jgi:hypothetical protein
MHSRHTIACGIFDFAGAVVIIRVESPSSEIFKARQYGSLLSRLNFLGGVHENPVADPARCDPQLHSETAFALDKLFDPV